MTTAPAGTPSRATIIGFVAAMSAVMPLTTDIYLILMPGIARDLGASLPATQGTMAVFAAGFGFAHLFVGVAADRWGRRPVAILGTLAFLIATLAVVLAPTLAALTLYRFLQGFVCATCPILARAIIRDAIAPHEVARSFSQANAISALAPLAAPFIGAWLAAWGGWRAGMAFLLVYGGALAVLVLLRLPETRPALTAAPPTPLAAAAQILSNRSFLIGAAIASLTYSALFTWLTTSPFLLIDTLGFSTTSAAVVYGIGSAGFLVGNLISIRLSHRLTPERILKWGTLLMLAGSLACLGALLGPSPHPALILAVMLPFYLGLGLVHANALQIVMRPFSTVAGQASAWLGLINQVAGALISLIAVALGAGLAAVGVTIACCVVLVLTAWSMSEQERTAGALTTPHR